MPFRKKGLFRHTISKTSTWKIRHICRLITHSSSSSIVCFLHFAFIFLPTLFAANEPHLFTREVFFCLLLLSDCAACYFCFLNFYIWFCSNQFRCCLVSDLRTFDILSHNLSYYRCS